MDRVTDHVGDGGPRIQCCRATGTATRSAVAPTMALVFLPALGCSSSMGSVAFQFGLLRSLRSVSPPLRLVRGIGGTSAAPAPATRSLHVQPHPLLLPQLVAARAVVFRLAVGLITSTRECSDGDPASAVHRLPDLSDHRHRDFFRRRSVRLDRRAIASQDEDRQGHRKCSWTRLLGDCSSTLDRLFTAAFGG